MKTQSLVPRSAYLANKISHENYYGQFVTPSIKNLVRELIGEKRIVNSTTPHFNDIELKLWDQFSQYSVFREQSKALKECGDGLSLSAVVCIAKEAARQIRLEAHR